MKQKFFVLSVILSISLFSCKENGPSKQQTNGVDTLTAAQQRLPSNALKGLVTSEGLETSVMATEPFFRNPTNIDVDDRGRVWVTEAYNYRPNINGNPTNALGDRIMILEDTNGDGKTDTSKVFYQGPELNAPLGICVLGNRVIVSQSPYVWSFYDDNGDDKADRKEILFQGIGGQQHDHGVHAFTFGPDGKLYFNFGNEGKTLRDKNDRPVRDQDGEIIGPDKYRQGMVFRCNPDGSQVEVLGHNFRNPFEVAVDSYGNLWQSDNDDDGNRGVRINYIMWYGNYGFTDEVTGAGWSASRTNMEDSIPFKHWHLNDPGATPNLLQTGAGSPTGMVIYEGNALPERFLNRMIHSDAGPNVVRSYDVAKKGAGYTATINNILKGEKDQWFRPADVCVAPDGSLIVADWYDPGVGGHAAGDQTRGRIYRVAKPGTPYQVTRADYNSPESAEASLQSPNLATRYKARMALEKMGSAAIPVLEKRWQSDGAPTAKARAFWTLLVVNKAGANKYLADALKSRNPELRIMGIRAAKGRTDFIDQVRHLVADTDPQVRRELAISLHHLKASGTRDLWIQLALQHDGEDRWYLEALGTGADRQWDSFMADYLSKVKDPIKSSAARDIIWRSRTKLAIPYLAMLAGDAAEPLKSRLRYFRAFDFNSGPEKAKSLLGLLEKAGINDTAVKKLVLNHLDEAAVRNSELAQRELKQLLQTMAASPGDEYIQLIRRYNVKTENENLVKLAIEKPDRSLGRNAAGLLFKLNGLPLIWKIISGSDTSAQRQMLGAIGSVGTTESVDLLQQLAFNKKYGEYINRQAALRIGNSGTGEDRVLMILKKKQVPAPLVPLVVKSVSRAWRGSVREEAASYLPDTGSAKSAPPPTIAELASLKTDRNAGVEVYKTYCATCHVTGNSGFDFGPALTEIGSKLPREALLEAIIHPSAGIGFGYEGWTIKMKDGSANAGIVKSKTETDIEMVMPGGSKTNIKTSDIDAMEQLKKSMMPEGLYKSFSKQDMANLLDYLSAMKKK
ncbi:PVC-type heme-binding CxxCH protein [Flavitalea sp.]|nr:PVC-type heme-binding CxxCH protein [Flavitalea sp.]